MDSQCILLNSMYDQYVKIMQDYNASCTAIQNQYKWHYTIHVPHSAVKQSVANYQLRVAGVIADVQHLYGQIEQVADLLKLLNIDFGDLPSLYLPSLALPALTIDWHMPRTPLQFQSRTAPEDIYANLADHITAVSTHLVAIANSSQSHVERSIETLAAFVSSFDGWFADYDPPVINTTQLLRQFEANQIEFAATVWEAVTNTTSSISTLS